MTHRTAVIVGNPKPASRTLAAALHLARGLPAPSRTSSSTLPPWDPPCSTGPTRVAALVDDVATADLLVVASPTYKGTYTGLLKLFLDRFDARQLQVVAVPLMLGAGPTHALAAAARRCRRCSPSWAPASRSRGLYVLDQRLRGPRLLRPRGWTRARPVVAALGAHGRARSDAACTAPDAFTTNQDLDPARLRQAFGDLPQRGGRRRRRGRRRARRPRRQLVHLGEPRPAAGLVLDREHVEDLAGPAPRPSRRRHRAGRAPRRRLPPAGRPGRPPLRHVPVRVNDDGAVTWKRGWPSSTARSTARSRPATTSSCCSACTASSTTRTSSCLARRSSSTVPSFGRLSRAKATPDARHQRETTEEKTPMIPKISGRGRTTTLVTALLSLLLTLSACGGAAGGAGGERDHDHPLPVLRRRGRPPPARRRARLPGRPRAGEGG